jgi:uncharacterized membrane protein YcaP (DUF421 family)
MFFGGWYEIIRVVIVGTLAYAGLIVVLRTTGKRTLSKMNAFDLVVTVALGSTLATVLLSSRTALATGLAAFALLAALQFLVAWASVRSSRIERLVKAEPRLLLHDGAFLDAAMRAERVTHDEILQALRKQGVASTDEVAAVVLETDGRLTVIRRTQGSASSLRDVA